VSDFDDESTIDEILNKYTKTALSIYAKNIAEGLKDRLGIFPESLVRESEKILLSTLTRRLIQVILQYMRENIDKILEDKIDVIEDQLRRIVRQELEHVKLTAIRKAESKPVVESTDIEKLKKKIIDISSQLRLCKMSLAKTSERLGKFFNLMLRFEPRFHALPIIEQAGEIEIDELARILRMKRDDLVRFLKITTEAGITYIRGNKVRLVTPIFKSST